jgi:SAM-dependent methyltransferase
MRVQTDQKRWDEKFRGKKYTLGTQANPFLRKHIRLLPRGKTLDVAAGEGRNAIFLAQHGFDVEAVDISKEGLRKARKLAKDKGVKIKTVLADLDHYPIERERYDLITDFYFLDRRLVPRIKRGVKKGGRVVFETYLMEHSNICREGPRNPKYLLKPNELLKLFGGFRVLSYREGIFREGGKKKAIASLIAEKF